MSYIIGTSGWQYKDWAGVFYPEDIRQKDWLEYYASRFDSVEINSTFYHMPSTAAVQKWHDTSPEGFTFAVKLNRYLTHSKRLNEDEDFAETLRDFYGRVRALGPKLTAVLVQLPPGLKQNLERLENLAVQTAEYEKEYGMRIRLAIEFRHASWFEKKTYTLMRRFNLANVINDSPDRWPASRAVTADFAYIRFHGSKELYRSRYTEAEMEQWAGFIKEDCSSCKDVLAYFNNDYNAIAPDNARSLMDKLH